MQIWCSHYETRCAFVPAEGPVVLFDYSYLPHLAEDLPTVDEYRAIPSFYYFAAGSNAEDRARLFADQIADLMKKHGGGNKRLAVDRLSHLGTDALRAEGLELHDGLPVTEHARAVKSAEELTLCMAAIHACEEGMRSMREAMRPGITENALWAKLHEANIRLGGEWIETRLLSSGPRTNPWFRECSMREIETGDLVAQTSRGRGCVATASRATSSGVSMPPPTSRSSTTSASLPRARASARFPSRPGRYRRISSPTGTDP
jgi:Xaa-Pro aminopeptidase